MKHQVTRADLPGVTREHLRQGECLPFRATTRIRLRQLHDGCSEGHRAHSAHHPGPPSLPGQRDGTIHESRHFARFRLRQLPHEVSSFVAPPTACLNGDNHQVTPTGCEDFRVLGLLVHPGLSQHGSVCGGRIGLHFSESRQWPAEIHRSKADLGPALRFAFRLRQGLSHSCLSKGRLNLTRARASLQTRAITLSIGPARFFRRPVCGHAVLWRPN